MSRPVWVPPSRAAEITGGLIDTNIAPPNGRGPEGVQVDIQSLHDGVIGYGGFQNLFVAGDGELGHSYNRDEPDKGLNTRDIRNATLNIGLGKPDKDRLYLDRADRTLRDQTVKAVLRHNLLEGLPLPPSGRYISNLALGGGYMVTGLAAELDISYLPPALITGAILGGNWAAQARAHGRKNLLPDVFLGFRPTRAILAARTLMRPLVRPTPLKNYR